MSVLDSYCMKQPSNQNALDIFSGEWASSIPGGVDSGSADLFSDPRISAMQQELGSMAGLDVLELGPLEGGHTALMHWMGTNSILSIEASQRAYLKTLITKEIFGLNRARILLGDFNEYLRKSTKQFDFILASGVIYHMKNPVETLGLILRHTDKVGIWSHYYDDSLQSTKQLRQKFSAKPETLDAFGINASCHRQEYAEDVATHKFCGGGQSYSYWIPKDDWFRIFDHHGFELQILQDTPDHPNGPSMTAVAKRL